MTEKFSTVCHFKFFIKFQIQLKIFCFYILGRLSGFYLLMVLRLAELFGITAANYVCAERVG